MIKISQIKTINDVITYKYEHEKALGFPPTDIAVCRDTFDSLKSQASNYMLHANEHQRTFDFYIDGVKIVLN